VAYLDVPVHDVLAVEVGERFTDVSKVALDVLLADSLHFDFLEERAAIGVFEYHIGDLALSVDVDVDELDDLGVGQSVVH
jgi:hypothetical protein